MKQHGWHRNAALAYGASAFLGFVCGTVIAFSPAYYSAFVLWPMMLAVSCLPLLLFQFKSQWIQVMATATAMTLGMMLNHLFSRFSDPFWSMTLALSAGVHVIVFGPISCLFWWIRRDGA